MRNNLRTVKMRNCRVSILLLFSTIFLSCVTEDDVQISLNKPLKSKFDWKNDLAGDLTYFRLDDSIIKVRMKNFQVEIDQKQFQLYLIDLDSNNCFSDGNVDKIGIALTSDISFDQDGFFIQDARENLKLQLDDEFYSIGSFDCDGQFQINRINSKQGQADIIFNTVPSSSVLLNSLFSDDSATMSELTEEGKYTYFGFWGTWCSFCVKYLPYSDSMTLLPNTNLVYINFLDEAEKAKAFISEYQMKGRHFKLEMQDQKAIGTSSFPSGIIVDQQKRIIRSNISPAKALKYLRSIQTNNTE